jgi:hypothetical protein
VFQWQWLLVNDSERSSHLTLPAILHWSMAVHWAVGTLIMYTNNQQFACCYCPSLGNRLSYYVLVFISHMTWFYESIFRFSFPFPHHYNVDGH